MAWGRIDDGFWCHPKVLRAGNAAIGVFVRLQSYCNQQLTDGVVPPEALEMIDPTGGNIERLLSAGLVVEGDGGEVRINDFLEYNDSRETVLTRRKQNAKRQKRARCKQAGHPEGDCECFGVSRDMSRRDTDRDSRRECAAPVLLPSRPVPSIEEEEAADEIRRVDEVYAATSHASLPLAVPAGNRTEMELVGCLPADRARLDYAITKTEQADKPNWGYFVKCLRSGPLESRAPPGSNGARMSELQRGLEMALRDNDD